jgi:hypothetical protein
MASGVDDAIDAYQKALREISRLPWWRLLRARDIARRVLGTGKYWNLDEPLNGVDK